MHRLQIKKKKKTRDTDTQTHTYTGLSVSGRLAVGCWLMCWYEARAQNTFDKINPNMVARFSQKFCIVENGHLSWVFCHIILPQQIHCLLAVVGLLMIAKIAL